MKRRRRGSTTALAVIGFFTLSTGPGARAQQPPQVPYSASFSMARGALAKGSVSGGDAMVFLFVDSGAELAGTVPPSAFQTGNTVGCIQLSIGSQNDFGCGPLAGASLNGDPFLSQASVSFSVPSSINAGGTLSAALSFAGNGPYVLNEQIGQSSNPIHLDPSTPQNSTAFLTVSGVAGVQRAAEPAGAVISSTLGGTPFNSLGAEGNLSESASGGVSVGQQHEEE